MKFILASKVSFPSAKLLRDYLGQFTSERIRVVSSENKVVNKNNILFSYGYPSEYSKLNSADFIRFCSNKKVCSDYLINNGFYSPEFKRTVPLVSDYPILVRSTLTGHGGRGINICQNREQFTKVWNPTYWWTKFVETNAEYRVHCFNGKILRLMRKDLVDNNVEENDYPVRNLDNGYHFSPRRLDNYDGIVRLVERLQLKLTGGIFYGLDLGYMPDKKDYFIFEINSACGLNDNTALLLAEQISEKLPLL